MRLARSLPFLGLTCLVACGPLEKLTGTGKKPERHADAHCEAPQAPAHAEQLEATVREYIRRLMDEPRQVCASAGHAAEIRGGPGNFQQLTEDQVKELVAAIIASSGRFYPTNLAAEHKAALVAVEISAESAFKMGTSGANPGDPSMQSVGVLQNTPGIWVPLFKQHANLPGLTHYDGSPWDVASTTDQMIIGSVWDNIHASLWAITEQGRRGAPAWLGGPDGPMPRTVWTGMLCWVIGAPAAASGQDLANQKEHYRNCQEADLALLGLPASLLDTPF